MKRNIFVFLILLFISSLMLNAESDIKETVIAEVGKEKITYAELEKAYNKNQSSKTNLTELNKDSIKNFLDLYIKYRLKVLDAKRKGYEEHRDVINDIETNRKILAESFYLEKKLTEPYVEKSIKRRGKEAKVAIILKTFSHNSDDSKDQAKKMALSALEKVKSGEDFSEVAKEFSDDKNTADNGGVIPGRITSGVVQREIEEAVFNTEEGKVYPELIKTKYGYIILKLLSMDKRELVYSSHILFSFGIGEDSSDVMKRADSVLTLLKNGKDFARLAKEVSDDNATASKGGSFDTPYSRSTGLEPSGSEFLPEYEKALFELKDGEYSDVVQTDYGMHIVKRDSTIDVNYNRERRNLEATYKRLYYNIDKNSLMDSLTEAYGMDIEMNVLQEVVTYLDTNYQSDDSFGNDVPEKLFGKRLYSFFGEDYTVSDYIDQMNSEKAVYGFGIDTSGLKKSIYVMNRHKVLSKATENLENEYPEFNSIMKEFKDGILLFKAEAEEVWNNLVFDTTLAKQYYDTLSKDLLTRHDYDISEILVKKEDEAQDLWKKLNNGADFEKIAAEETIRKGYREKKGSWGRLTVGKDVLADKAHQKNAHSGDILPPFKYQNGWAIIKVNAVHPPRKKTFEEAVPDIAPAVQDIKQKILTEKWLNNVKANTDIVIHENKIDEIIKKSSKK